MNLFSRPSAYEQRVALLAERDALKAELNANIGDQGPRHDRSHTALNAVRGHQGQGRPVPPKLTEEADNARLAMQEGDARQEAIRSRLAEIADELAKPLALSAADIKAHAKTLKETRERLAKLETAREAHAITLAQLEAVDDPRPLLPAQRAEIQAGILAGDGNAADLERFDAQSAPVIAEAAAHQDRLIEARQIAEALDGKRSAVQAELDASQSLTAECKISVLTAEIATARLDLEGAHKALLTARQRFDGLADLLRHLGRSAAPAVLDAPVEAWQAAQIEATRLRGLHPALF